MARSTRSLPIRSGRFSTAQAMVETAVSLVSADEFDDLLETDGQLAARYAAAGDREFDYLREVGGQIDLATAGQGDDVVDADCLAEPARDAPGEGGIAGHGFEAAGIAAASRLSTRPVHFQPPLFRNQVCRVSKNGPR